LGETRYIRDRLEGKATQITSFCQGHLDMIAELRKLEKAKEDARVCYDYYRTKGPKPQKGQAESKDQKKQEKETSIAEKKEEADKAFGKVSNELINYLLRLESRTDVVLN